MAFVFSRMRRLIPAGLVIILVVCSALHSTAYVRNLVIPWVDEPATPALIRSLMPKPLPAPTPQTNAPPCTSSVLVLQPTSNVQWSQNDGVAIELRNTGTTDCLARGRPRVVATAAGHPRVVATSLGLAATDGEVANTAPGDTVDLDVSAPIACAANPGGSDQGLPTYHHLTITLPSGGTRTINGLSLTFPCGMSVSPFFTPKPAPAYAPYWIKYLKPHVALPTSAKAGGILVYEVTLSNPLSRSVALSPCPAYVEHSSTGIKLEYQLNCSVVHTVPAHGSFTYQMKMVIPSTTPSAPMTVFWGLSGPGTVSSRGTVDVRRG